MATIHKLGPFRLDAKAEILFRGGEPIALGQRAVALLRVLVERASAPVSKDALIEAAWPGLMVEESNLPVQIAALRRVLGEEAGGELWIETLQRRGYRYVGPLVAIEDNNPTTTVMMQANVQSNLPDKPSIAVLPFNNMSDDPEQEFFADGLTEDLITALSHWRSFSIIARNSTFAYKGKFPDVREVAKHLGVHYMLEGSVRTSGDRVRISAQLIDGESGKHVWAEKYDRKLEDFFDLQDEMTQVIAAKVEPEFARAEQKRAIQKPNTNLASWEWYQRGVAALDTVTKEGNIHARKCFERAIELDPTHSRNYAGMAYALFRYLFDGLAEPGEVENAEIVEFAKRAVALDEADALGHHTLALSLLYLSGAHDLSIAEAQRAVELNPNFSQAHVPLGNALSFIGKPKEGIPHLELAIRLNPDDIRNHIYLTYLAEAHLNNRDYAQSVACARKGLQRKSNYAYSYFVLSSALGHLGESKASGEALAECLRIQPGYIDIQRKIHRYRDPADRRHIEDGLRGSGWEA
jgi:TolB-like protein